MSGTALFTSAGPPGERRRVMASRFRVACVLACGAVLSLGVGSASAATLDVTRTDDPAPDGCNPGDCSLREAVVVANANTDADTINVPAGTYTLAIPGSGEAEDGDLELGEDDVTGTESGPLTILGAGARTTTVSGGGIDRVFDVQGEEVVSISGLTVTGGNTDQDGGGIQIDDGDGDGSLTLSNVAVVGNTAVDQDGGGIDNNGNLAVFESTISGNTGANGGGIEHDDATTLVNVTMSGNVSTADASDGDLGGGAIDNDGDDTEAGETEGILTITNSTIAANSATAAGGGISNDDGGSNAEAVLKNTIIAGNSSSAGGANCAGIEDITTQGANLEDADTCDLTAPDDQRSTDPQLGALQDNGGETDTQAITDTSPAKDTADAASCPATDQRGVTRPQGAGCDRGAFEAEVAGPGTPLIFEITGRKKQKPAGPQVKPGKARAKNPNRKVLSVKATCQNQSCEATIRGKAKAQGKKLKFKPQTVSLQAGETKKLRLAGSKRQLASVKAALREGAKGKAKIKGTATGAAGETASDGFKVKLRGK